MKPCLPASDNRRAFSDNRLRLLQIALIILVGTVCYANSLQVPFVLDDNFSISFYGQKNLLDLLFHGSSRRLADITFALNYKLHGLQVTGYHLVNVAIHLATALVLYFVIRAAITALQTTYPAPGTSPELPVFIKSFVPLAVSLFFVSHPIQTQAVTYIIQRYTSLSTFFYLVAVLLFLRARLAYLTTGRTGYPLLLAVMSLSAGLCALGCKQTAVTLPLVLLLLEIFLFDAKLITRRFYIACAACFAVILGIVLIRYHDSSLHDFLFDLNYVTAEDHNTSRTTYFLTQLPVVAAYLRLLLLPIGQSLLHDAPVFTSLASLPVVISLGLHLCLISGAVILFRRSRGNIRAAGWTRGVLQRLASLGIIWFYVTMAPESSFLPIRDVMFEHRIYLPSIGFFMTVSALLALISFNAKADTRIPWIVVAILSLALCGLTIARNHTWNDSLLFWSDIVQKAPNNPLAIANLGTEYAKRDMPEKALRLFVRATERNANLQVYQIGETLQRLKLYPSRFTSGREFMRPGGPLGTGILDRADIMKYESVTANCLGLAYEYLREPDKAANSYRRSIWADPAYDLAWYNLGLLSVRNGDRVQAAAALSELKKINPTLAGSLASGMAQP